MPELPEVETMRRGIEPIIGSRIEGVDRIRCQLKPIDIRPSWTKLRRRVTGRTIAAVERIGKQLILRLDTGERLVIHPRMTGLVLLSDPPDLQHARLRFRLCRASSGQLTLWYWDRRGLSTVTLLSPEQFQQQFSSNRFGPDALTISPGQLRERFCSSRRPIKPALLDQRRLAGIGNLYASEILHAARIHPAQRCCNLTPAAWNKLARAIRQVLQAAIRYEGSTLPDATYRNVQNQPGRYQRCHRVYGRAGQICLSCRRATVLRIIQEQRSTFFCPNCQQLNAE